MKVKIADVHEEDGFFQYRDQLVGQVVETVPGICGPDGVHWGLHRDDYCAASVLLERPVYTEPHTYQAGENVFLYRVKLEEVQSDQPVDG